MDKSNVHASHEKFSGGAPPHQANAPPPPPHVPHQIQPQKRGPWSTGLCDCFSDPGNFCMTCWLPCVTFGQIAEIVDKGSSTCLTSGALYALICCTTSCSCFLSCCYRRKLRQQFFLNGNVCTDCLVHGFCEPCALSQEFRELKNQGYDVAMGWHGNADKHKRDTQMVPVSTEGMTR